MVLVLGIVKASLEILGIGIGIKKVVLLMSVLDPFKAIIRSNAGSSVHDWNPENLQEIDPATNLTLSRSSKTYPGTPMN